MGFRISLVIIPAYLSSLFSQLSLARQTDGLEPFQYVANATLVALLGDFGISEHVPLNGPLFMALIDTWARLQPWPGVSYTLRALAKASAGSRKLAPLSNGARYILEQAAQVFVPDGVLMADFFSSDFPVGAFKPQPVMYEQLAARSQLDPRQILHVAGAPIDAQGARLAGLFSALAWNAPLPGVQPCFVLSNITQLLAVLQVDDHL